MLTKIQNQPFKYTINNLKKIMDSRCIEKEQDHIKSTLNTLTQITNLNQLLKLLVDSHCFSHLSYILTKLHNLFISQPLNEKNVTTYENLPSSPTKSGDKNRQLLLKYTKKIDLTPSTKKSRVLSTPTVTILIEDLVDNLQKFDQIKHNSKRIKLLIASIYDDLLDQDQTDPQSVQEINLDMAWRQLSLLKLDNGLKNLPFSFTVQKTQIYIQLLQQIQIIYKFMQVLKTTTHDIFSLIDPKSDGQLDQQSHDSYNLEAITKKSNNPTSQQRSLLTQVLRDSSQKSNFEIQQNEYTSQIVLRPRFKQYSQNNSSAHLDEQFRLSYKSAKPYDKSHNKLIRSEMNYYDGQNDQNFDNVKIPIRRKEVKIKRTQLSCSRCEIF